jgi:hypothetical protein
VLADELVCTAVPLPLGGEKAPTLFFEFYHHCGREAVGGKRLRIIIEQERVGKRSD